MAKRTPDICKNLPPILDGAGTTGRIQRRRGRRQKLHEESKTLDIADGLRGRAINRGVRVVIRDRKKLTRRVIVALSREELVADTHLDIIGFPGKQQQRRV